MKHGPAHEPSPSPRKSPAEERLGALVHSQSPDVLLEVAGNPALTEDLALALLARRDLPRGLVEVLVKNASVMKSRPVINAVARHPKTPRFIALPLLRHLYVFELMRRVFANSLRAERPQAEILEDVDPALGALALARRDEQISP